MYKVLDEDSIKDYVDKTREIRSLVLQDSQSINELDVNEIGDGNLNFVYILKSKEKSIILKQAVPYLRCVGVEYPLSRIRMTFEIEALKTQKELCPSLVPDIFYSSHDMSLVVMQNLDKHKILRTEMINRVIFPLLSEHISTFLADTLFYTSDFYMDSDKKKEDVKKFINVELCKITEDFIFTHPYEENDTNEYNPKLDFKHVKKFREDTEVKAGVLEMKYKFMTNTQALLHGDLHSGSIMLNQKETYVIDPEFAFYGPIGFDVGIYLANLIMNYFSLASDEKEYGNYVLGMIKETWEKFGQKFKNNMIENEKQKKSLQFDYPNGLHDLEYFTDKFIKEIFEDTIGFASCEMLRRTVGLAKVADIAEIEDLERRARVERRVLESASLLIKSKSKIQNIDEIINMIKKQS
ncbi:MAG: S-methyl-5-thioribose kinase [Epsilonproteobacteria bacterium]|nr:S-methyl-5-thioribose kinase [Campylobacterota bacterium]